jgi:hypothetical protein
MTDHRTEIDKRVMRSLEETTDPEELVSAYFDVDHDIVAGHAADLARGDCGGWHSRYHRAGPTILPVDILS